MAGRERLERERLEQEDPRFVITMVHGTWARNAPWTGPESPFSRWLRSQLAPAHIHTFKWSARNSVSERAEAIQKLRSELVELRSRYPNAHHAIVAHSHGGNVALSALADKELAAGMLGVAALATPFLDAKFREPEWLLEPTDAAVAATFAGIAVFAAGAALGHGRSWWLPALVTSGAIAAALLAAAAAAKAMRAHAGRVCELMPATCLQPSQLTIVRTSADEAAAALSGARVAGGFASIFWSIASGPAVQFLRRWLDRLNYLGARTANGRAAGVAGLQPTAHSEADTIRRSAISYVPLLVLMLLDSSSVLDRSLGAVFAVLYGVPAMAALILDVVAVPFAVLGALGLLPCGWSLPLAGPYLDLTVEPTPPETWSVTQLRGVGRRSLSHSNAHDDISVFAHVSRWLERRAAKQPSGNGAGPHIQVEPL